MQSSSDDRHSRRDLVRALALGLATPLVWSCAHRSPGRRTARIGFLLGQGYPQLAEAFDRELNRLGFLDGRNIVIERRFARLNSNDAQVHAIELAGMDLDLIVASALPFALLVREANPRMPMVIGTGAGLVSNGFGKSMSHPGGNATGMDELPPGLTSRRLALLKQAAPAISKVALLSTTPGVGGHEIQLADAGAGGRRLGLAVKAYRATNRDEIELRLNEIVRDGMDGLLNFQGGLSLGNRQIIVDFVAEHRLPGIYQAVLFAEAGGLMSWAPDQNEQLREAARSTARILRGENPGDLPIKYPPRYFLTVNRGAAARIGLVLPAKLLAEADRIL